MSDLTVFLRARLDEDEQAAKAATPGPWTAQPVIYGPPEDGWGKPDNWEIHAEHDTVVTHQTHEGGGIDEEANARHIARHDPARVLAEVEAKRRIVALHCVRSGTGGDWDTDPAALCNECGTPSPCETLELLALPYAGHADYRPEWAP